MAAAFGLNGTVAETYGTAFGTNLASITLFLSVAVTSCSSLLSALWFYDLAAVAP